MIQEIKEEYGTWQNWRDAVLRRRIEKMYRDAQWSKLHHAECSCRACRLLEIFAKKVGRICQS